jgi:hypothetical protein
LDEITIRKKRKLFPGSPLASPVLFALLLKAFLKPYPLLLPKKKRIPSWKGGALLPCPQSQKIQERRGEKGVPRRRNGNKTQRFLRSLNIPFHFRSEMPLLLLSFLETP